jgi:hypothetical protein
MKIKMKNIIGLEICNLCCQDERYPSSCYQHKRNLSEVSPAVRMRGAYVQYLLLPG